MPHSPSSRVSFLTNLQEYTGQGSGDGNKWTCGARLIQSPCVVYSFGSNNDMKCPGCPGPGVKLKGWGKNGEDILAGDRNQM
jgi:hypothetical protein